MHLCTEHEFKLNPERVAQSEWMPMRIEKLKEPTKEKIKQSPCVSHTDYARRNYYYDGQMVAVAFRSNLMATLNNIPNPYLRTNATNIELGQPTRTTGVSANRDRERRDSRPGDTKRGQKKRKAIPSNKVDKKSGSRKRNR